MVTPNDFVKVETKIRILTVAERVLLTAVGILGSQGMSDRRGGYLCVNDLSNSPYVISRFGMVPEDKVFKYFFLAREKCRRLSAPINSPHVTSYESRDPTARVCDEVGAPWGKWGGAVKAYNFYFGFSGFPELMDEAAMFVTAIRLDELHEDNVLPVISETRNQFLRPLLEACHWIE